MITLHAANAADVAGLGLGVLNPKGCTVTEEGNGMYELLVRQPIRHDGKHALLETFRLIKAPVPVREAPFTATIEVPGTTTVNRDIYRIDTTMRLYMWSAPSIDSKRLQTYAPGTEVIKLEDAGEDSTHKWMKAQVREGGAIGYFAREEKVGGSWLVYLTYVRTETETAVGDNPGSLITPTQAREQLFRIYSVERNAAHNIVTAYAQHIFYDLRGVIVNSDYVADDVPANVAVAQIFALADHSHPFSVYCGVTETISGDYTGRNLIDCLLNAEDGILTQVNAHLIRDNYSIYIVPGNAERDRGIRIQRGKNLLKANLTTDIADVVTRIIPVGTKEDGTPLVGAAVDSEHINEYPLINTRRIAYNVTVSDIQNETQALIKLQNLAKAEYATGIDEPTVTLDAAFVRTELLPEYAAIASNNALHMFDEVAVIDNHARINGKLRMTAYTYDCLLKRYTDTELGRIVYKPEEDPGIEVSNTFTASLTGTYSGSWHNDNDYLFQGAYGSVYYSGCMWFPLDAIANKKIISASLYMRRIANTGTWRDVTVYLQGTTATGKSGNPNNGAVDYGAIGSVADGATVTLEIPAQAVQDLAYGITKGLMLRVQPDTFNYGYEYSDNYSGYYGISFASAKYGPQLTVNYYDKQ